LTRDDTLVNQLFDNGEIGHEDLDRHPMKNVLLQALGTLPNIQPHAGRVAQINKNDRFLICSDGIYDVYTNAELEALLQMNNTSFMIECMRTVAMERKASDNFSAIIIDFEEYYRHVVPITKELNILK